MRLKDQDLLNWLLDWLTHEGYRAGAKGLNRANLSAIALGNGNITRVGRFVEVEGREDCPALERGADREAGVTVYQSPAERQQVYADPT